MSQKMKVTINKETGDVEVLACFVEGEYTRKFILDLAEHMIETYEKVSEAVRKEGAPQ